jgi:hypothetical protein
MTALADAGKTVLLETSGLVTIQGVDPRVRIIMDLKCPDCGECDNNQGDSRTPWQLATREGPFSGGDQTMIDPSLFADKQLELAAEFAQYIADHPEVDDLLPEKSHVYFEIEGEAQFNRYSRELAERQIREDAAPLVLVRIKGLAPPQGSRLIDPVIELAPAVG